MDRLDIDKIWQALQIARALLQHWNSCGWSADKIERERIQERKRYWNGEVIRLEKELEEAES